MLVTWLFQAKSSSIAWAGRRIEWYERNTKMKNGLLFFQLKIEQVETISRAMAYHAKFDDNKLSSTMARWVELEN